MYWGLRTTVGILSCSFALSIFAEGKLRPDMIEFIDEVVKEHAFDKRALTQVFSEVELNPRIIEIMEAPAESKAWAAYRKRFITRARINRGVAFYRRHKDILRTAEDKFHVPAALIVAIIGVETDYGRVLGNYAVIDAISTLAFDYPKRAVFFRKELEQFLLLSCEERVKPFTAKDSCNLTGSETDVGSEISIRDLVGSYAGAMGIGQFIPSSFRHFAIDFDGDSRRDIWTNVNDAIGSIANYFSVHDWRGGETVVLQTDVDEGNQTLVETANKGLKPSYTLKEWKSIGLNIVSDENRSAALFLMEAEDGPEYWLGFHDFYVITRYNHSPLYALAVSQLAMELEAELDIENFNPPLTH